MTAQHTPGPWALNDDLLNIDGNNEVVIRLDAAKASTTDTWGRKTIGWLDGTPRDDEEQQANARLIAAAPLMLEALKYAHSFMAEHYEWWTDGTDEHTTEVDIFESIGNAIRAATGEDA